jgi:4-hydroxy-4-methyl-2-oxoglutarate aldolase
VTTDAGFDFASAPTAAIADALGSINVLDPAVRPVWSGARVFGPAYTVRCHAQSIITVHKALLEAPGGSVLVVDGGGDAVGALFGGMMAREAKGQHLAGLVTDGAVRDSEDLRELGFPVFARAVTPRVGTNRRVGSTNVAVSCGGCIVNPGDYVLGDADGVVVIPQGRLTEIGEAVAAIKVKEQGWQTAMSRGERLADLIGFRALIQ